ncbi:hypothetical protein BTHE_3000 [Bifidobacterium thermophilum]|nr:hypothetical protein BTHE_3000 [Bifidobacterium thermophilum]
MEDCSLRPASRPARVSGIDAYAQAVGTWLGADLRMPRKQQHTARRVHDRPVAERRFGDPNIGAATINQIVHHGAQSTSMATRTGARTYSWNNYKQQKDCRNRGPNGTDPPLT